MAASSSIKENTLQRGKMLLAYPAQDWDEVEVCIAECRSKSNGEIEEFYNLYAGRVAVFRDGPSSVALDSAFVAATG